MAPMKRGAIVGGAAALVMALSAAPAAATFPGQNGSIVYVDRGHVMTMNPDGSNQTQLTNGAGNFDPAFSASGKKITYAHKVGKHQAIDVMNADGSHKRQLTSKHFDQTPAFSPNGRKIVFSRGLHTKQYEFSGIFVMRANGSHVKELTHDRPVFSDEEAQPSYSPNGKTIVFQNLLSEDGGISAIDSNGKHVRGLTSERVEPSFAPSGNQILFAELFGAQPQIGTMDSDGKHAHDLTNNHNPNFNFALPNYSPDGTKIAFAGGPAGIDIYVMNPDGSGMTKLTTDGHSAAPDWGALPVE
jgi:Tol biopolymer transport system component